MELIKLTDVCDFQGGTQPPKSDWKKENLPGYIRMLQIRDFTQIEKNYVEYVFNKPTLKKCKKEDVLIGRYGASIGKICSGLEGAYNVALVKTIPDIKRLDRSFLLYILKGKEFQNFISNIGSRAAQAGFNKGDLENFKIPLPPLATQQKIAAILDAADELRQKDKALVAKYDELTQALFLDMFGDPVTNPKGWEKKPLKQFGNIITGNTPSRAEQDNYSIQGLEWIKTDNISENNLYVSQASEYLSDKGLKKARTVEKGAVLIACIAGSIESIGRAALTDRKVSFNQQINAIYPNTNVDSRFLYYQIRFSKKHIQNHASSGMKRMLSKGEFEKILMISPSLKLQNQFAERVKAIEEQKIIAQESALKSEELFNSLLQKAFNGELV